MKIIYKYPLKIMPQQDILLSAGAKILTVQMQENFPVLWAIIDSKLETQRIHRIFMYITGEPLPDTVNALEYIAAIQLRGYVFHIFEG